MQPSVWSMYQSVPEDLYEQIRWRAKKPCRLICKYGDKDYIRNTKPNVIVVIRANKRIRFISVFILEFLQICQC